MLFKLTCGDGLVESDRYLLHALIDDLHPVDLDLGGAKRLGFSK